MAIDVYLHIDGIKGESADSTHQGWIEISAAQWGVIQPKSATASTGGRPYRRTLRTPNANLIQARGLVVTAFDAELLNG